MSDNYYCAMCGEYQIVEGDLKEAKEEALENLFDVSDCELVCHACFKETPWGKYLE